MKYLHSVVFWIAGPLVICINVTLAVEDSQMTIPRFASPRRAFDKELDGERINHRLRTTDASIAEANSDYEDRAFTAITKVKEFTQKGTKNLQKFAKDKLTSNNQYTTDKLFKQFKVDQAKPNIFGSSQLENWKQAVTKAYNYDLEGDNVMISTLTQRYKDDGLARMLASAKQDEAILSTVIHWESAQRYYWKSAGKTEDDVFKLLKLDEAGTNVLKSPILQTWRSYVRDFVGKNPNSELLRKLKASYGDVGLAKMIIMSKNDKTGRPTATELEKLLFDGWKKDKAQVGDVFKLLRLNEEGGTLLKNPVLQTWVSFVEMRKKNPYELLFLAIRSGRYDEAGLTRMITAAKNDRITGPIAVKLEELQLKNWLKQEKSSEEVFKLLGLGLPQNRDNMFTNPAWNTWDTYLARKFESDQVMFNVLRTQLGDQTLTKMVAKAITVKNTEAIATRLAPNIWWMNKQSSDDVFKLLNLDKMDKKLFESPEIIYWVQYVNKLDDFKSHPDNFMMVNKLQKLYGNYVLARMLAMAKRRTDNSQSMKDTVLYLQKMQFNQWMLQKKTPTKIRYQLRSSKMPANENAKVFRDFKAYYKDNIHSLNLMVAH